MNPRSSDYKSDALPTMLHQHIAAPRSGFVGKAGTSGALNQPSFNVLRTASRTMNYILFLGVGVKHRKFTLLFIYLDRSLTTSHILKASVLLRISLISGSLTFKSMPMTSGKAENIARRRFEPPLETSLWLFGIDIITDASGSHCRT